MPETGMRKRLLIVDDEKMIANTLALIFTNTGYETKAVYDAEQGLALIETWVPDAALIDVGLPGMNGIDFALWLKAEYPECHVTLFSGQASTMGLVEQAQQDGHIMKVVPKPVHPDELIRLVAAAPMH